MSPSLRPEISNLWGKLSTLYGATFTKPYGVSVDINGVWHQSLSLVSADDIEYGFKKLLLTDKYNTFPPNPMQFRELCIRSEKKALPSVKDAYLEAKHFHDSDTHIWSHHAVKFCAIKTSTKLLHSSDSHEDIQKSWEQFKELYEKVILAVNGGLNLPHIEKPNQPNNSITNKSVGQSHLTKIRKILSKGVH
jgi:hypothetical protein